MGRYKRNALERQRLLGFSKRLKFLLRIRDIKQNALAARLGISSYAVSQWVRGYNYPAVDNIVNVCEILGTTPDHLLGFTDDINRHV